jgi:competence protein ComGC
MLKVNKMNVNLLDWMNVDLETTGQAEIDHWRKLRALKSEGIINEQQKDNWEDGIVTNKSSRFEVLGTRT